MLHYAIAYCIAFSNFHGLGILERATLIELTTAMPEILFLSLLNNNLVDIKVFEYND